MARRSSKKAAVPSAHTGSDDGGKLASFGTSLIVSEIILRSAGRLTRQTMEKAVARRRHDPAQANAIVENRGMLHTLAAFGVSRIATRSIPGALVVGGGLLVKTMFDRGSAKRKLRRRSRQSVGTTTAD